MYTGQCIHKYINPTYQELKHFRKRHKTFKETPAIQIYRTLQIHEKGKKKKEQTYLQLVESSAAPKRIQLLLLKNQAM